MSGQARVSVIIILSLFSALSMGATRAEFPFLLGVSQGADEAVPIMEELGIKWGRSAVMLKEVMPELADPLPSLDKVRGNAARVDEFIKAADWEAVDAKMRYRLDHGITPIVSVGHGWHSAYASYQGQEAHPDHLGRDHYLAYMYLYTRATVERYDGDGHLDAPGIVIRLWQTENELNQAALTAGGGWRKPAWLGGLLNSAWSDWEFVTEVMAILYEAVHDADPEAMTMMNFHTDIHPKLNRLFNQPDWMEAVADWKDHMDIVGFDAYPNYYVADPGRSEVIGERTRTIKSIVGDKPVIIVEIDYPNAPDIRGFSPEKQAQFLRQSYDAARAAGVDGYMKFRVIDPKDNPVVITEKDLKNLDKIVPWYEEGKVGSVEFGHEYIAGYVQNHFLDVLKSVEGHWGVIGPNGQKLPAYDVLKEIIKENEAN